MHQQLDEFALEKILSLAKGLVQKIKTAFRGLKFGKSATISFNLSSLNESFFDSTAVTHSGALGVFSELVTAYHLANHLQKSGARLTKRSDVALLKGAVLRSKKRLKNVKGAFHSEIVRMETAGKKLAAKIHSEAIDGLEDLPLLTFDIKLSGTSEIGRSKADLIITAKKDSVDEAVRKIMASLKVYNKHNVNIANTSFVNFIKILFYGNKTEREASPHAKDFRDNMKFIEIFIKDFGNAKEIRRLNDLNGFIPKLMKDGSTRTIAKSEATKNHPEIVNLFIKIVDAHYEKHRDVMNRRILKMLGLVEEETFYYSISGRVISSKTSPLFRKLMNDIKSGFYFKINKRGEGSSANIIFYHKKTDTELLRIPITFSDEGKRNPTGKAKMHINFKNFFKPESKSKGKKAMHERLIQAQVNDNLESFSSIIFESAEETGEVSKADIIDLIIEFVGDDALRYIPRKQVVTVAVRAISEEMEDEDDVAVIKTIMTLAEEYDLPYDRRYIPEGYAVYRSGNFLIVTEDDQYVTDNLTLTDKPHYFADEEEAKEIFETASEYGARMFELPAIDEVSEGYGEGMSDLTSAGRRIKTNADFRKDVAADITADEFNSIKRGKYPKRLAMVGADEAEDFKERLSPSKENPEFAYAIEEEIDESQGSQTKEKMSKSDFRKAMGNPRKSQSNKFRLKDKFLKRQRGAERANKFRVALQNGFVVSVDGRAPLFESEEELNEIMSRIGRLNVRKKNRKYAAKRNRRRKLALRRRANTKVINNRARRMARKELRNKFLHGRSWNKLGFRERQYIEGKVAKRKSFLDRRTKKLRVKERQIERDRMSNAGKR